MGKMILNGKEYVGGRGSSKISELDDVALTSIASGQILEWDSVLEKFKNVNKPNGIVSPFILKDLGNADGTPLSKKVCTINQYASLSCIKFSRYGVGYCNISRDSNNAYMNGQATMAGTTFTFSLSGNDVYIYVPEWSSASIIGITYGSVTWDV